MTRGHSGWRALLDAPHPRDLTDEQWNFIGPFLPEWRAERTWLQNFRRIVVRYERVAENFLGMPHLACSLILLRGL
jgi:transposase